jgi:hypothetical protein
MRACWLCFALCLAACSYETRQRGQSCQRTAQCALGLGCVAGRCTTNLAPVAEGNTVPSLGAGTGGAAAGESGNAGGAGDATTAGESGNAGGAGDDMATAGASGSSP